MLKVDPIIIVQIAKIYPTILALRALSSKVCKKAARPICAKIHPMATIIKSAVDVSVKKLVYSTNAPSIKKITFVVRASRKLKSP
jgi:hypothetical protein